MSYIYTIIIPHKNSPKLLQRCLNSIPRRDDLHIIVVDDNSDPDKVDFECFPGYDRDDVEIIFTKEGKGAGHARNVGLDHVIDTKWIIFSDADDFFYETFPSILDNYKDSNYDVIYFLAKPVDSDTLGPTKRIARANKYIEGYSESDKLSGAKVKYLYSEPWGKIYNYNLIKKNQIRFQETIICNDVKFSYLTGYYCKSLHVDKQYLYYVTCRNNSVSQNITEKATLTRFSVTSEWQKFLNDKKVPITIDYFDDLLLPLAYDSIHNKKLFRKKIRILKDIHFSDLEILVFVLRGFKYWITRKIKKSYE